MRYGFVEHAHRIIEAQLAASGHHNGRLPELFAGFSRSDLAVPAPYPTSCSPQAWAAAAPLLWLRTLLRLDPAFPHGQVWMDPELPGGMSRLRVDGMHVAGANLSLEVDGNDLKVDSHGGLHILHRARPPIHPVVETTENDSRA